MKELQTDGWCRCRLVFPDESQVWVLDRLDKDVHPDSIQNWALLAFTAASNSDF